jgi:uncharacterized membrane protein
VPPDAAPGAYTVRVTESDGGDTATLPINVNVAKVVAAGIGISADFPSLKGGPTDTFTYTLTVTNNTPTAQAFNFAAQGPEGWTVTAAPQADARAATLTIEGGSGQVSVAATPPATVAASTYALSHRERGHRPDTARGRRRGHRQAALHDCERSQDV